MWARIWAAIVTAIVSSAYARNSETSRSSNDRMNFYGGKCYSVERTRAFIKAEP